MGDDGAHGKILFFSALEDGKLVSCPEVSTYPNVQFYGRRLKRKEMTKQSTLFGVFTRVQVWLPDYGDNRCYKVEACWASFVQDAVGTVIWFKGGGGGNAWRRSHHQWIIL